MSFWGVLNYYLSNDVPYPTAGWLELFAGCTVYGTPDNWSSSAGGWVISEPRDARIKIKIGYGDLI